MSKVIRQDPDSLTGLACACATVCRTARLVTRFYSQELGPGVEPGQFLLLSVLSGRPGASQGPLGRSLGLDKTTMSRSLRLMQRNGWIEPVASEDRRERGFQLTPAGKKVLSGAVAGWKRAQAQLRAALGPEDWETFFKIAGSVAEAARTAKPR